MATRRDVVSALVAAAVPTSLASVDARAATAGAAGSRTVLFLGATGNIGPYLIRAAIDRGHRVSAFIWDKEGRSDNLSSSVERLYGDRNGDLRSLNGREWDAVVDVATYGPLWVKTLGEALRGRVGHYIFISTASVYDLSAPPARIDERHPVLEYKGKADPFQITSEGEYYGELKILCEREAERQFQGKTTILRPGYIGGPGDTHDILGYWPMRARQQGEILAAGNPEHRVQYLDVRDLADWLVRLIADRTTGIYNAVGPESQLSASELIALALRAAGNAAVPTWIPGDWLSRNSQMSWWGTLLFWEINQLSLCSLDNRLAIAKGFRARSVSDTLEATYEWMQTLPPERIRNLNTGFLRTQDGTFKKNVVSWTDYLEQEKATLAKWHAANR